MVVAVAGLFLLEPHGQVLNYGVLAEMAAALAVVQGWDAVVQEQVTTQRFHLQLQLDVISVHVQLDQAVVLKAIAVLAGFLVGSIVDQTVNK